MPGSRAIPAVLILLSIAALATENLSHYPIGVMSILGVYYALLRPRDLLSLPNIRWLIAIFSCIWIPMLIALPDAANPERAFKTTLLYLHYLPASLYISYSLRDLLTQRIVLFGVASIIAFWCVDGVIQLVAGRDLFGYPYDGSVLKGVFYPKQRFGLILAVFAPVYFYVVRLLAARSAFAWILLLPFVVAVMYSLKRTAWIMLAVAIVAFVLCFFRWRRANARSAFLASSLVAMSLVLMITFVPNINTQFNNTLKIFSVEFEQADLATSHRLSLWKTGLSIVKSHWVNGVGPRGFRVVYRDYASADDFWIKRGKKGQTHPHLMMLEVLVETGVIGFVGYLLALILVVSVMWRARARDPSVAVYLMVVFVAWFPLNAHLAFYGSYWSNIAWLMLGLGCAKTAYEKH